MDEGSRDARSQPSYDAVSLNPIGRAMADAADRSIPALALRKLFSFATWNVRSLYEGKLEIILNEIARAKLHVLGISERSGTLCDG